MSYLLFAFVFAFAVWGPFVSSMIHDDRSSAMFLVVWLLVTLGLAITAGMVHVS